MKWIDAIAVTCWFMAASGACAQGTALPPLPETLSAQAKAQLEGMPSPPPGVTPSLAQMRAFSDQVQAQLGARDRQRYAVNVQETTMGGVPVRILSPQKARGSAVLMNLHGGGFEVDSGSLTENIPLAALTGYQVVAVRYRLAPEHPFPAGVDDALAVYKALLKTHPGSAIGVYGTSAGAIMVPEMMVRLRAEHLPLPGAMGVFSGDGDLARTGDSARVFAPPTNVLDLAALTRAYAGDHDLKDPLLSPSYGTLTGFPPTLCLSSTRDFFLSSTANICRDLDTAGVPVKLLVFDGLPHAFWSYIEAPEADQAFAAMARFFRSELKSGSAAKAP